VTPDDPAADLADAVRAYRHAREDIDAARDRAARIVDDAKASAERARLALAVAIVAAARAGMRQRDIVQATGYNREMVRRIVRAAGITPGTDD
jgi:hypothetical protein